MSEDKIRDEFEAWARTQEWTIDLIWRSGYIAWEAQFAFDAWKASRATLAIELPDDIGAFSPLMEGFEEGINYARIQIEKAGIKVHP